MNESHLDTTHFSITILQYPHYTDLQHTLSLPSSPKQRPDHFTTSLPQLGQERAGGRFVSVSPPLASGVLASKVSEFTRAPQSSAPVGPGGTEETGKASKNWAGGDYHLGLPMSKGISDGKVSHLPLPQPSQNTLQCCDTKAASM